MKKIIFTIVIILLCFPLFGQNLNSNQIRVNNRTFTVGTNTYAADYNVIFNQWYRGHKSADEARQGEDLSWINDFTRTYNLDFQEGDLSISDNVIGRVKAIIFFKSGGMRDRFGDIALISIRMQLVYDNTTDQLIGAQLFTEAYNAYFNITPVFFDIPEFVFPLRVDRINTPVSNFNTSQGLVSYKNVYEYRTDRSITNGVLASIFNFNNTILQTLKEADDYAKSMRRDIPALRGTIIVNSGFIGATHRLTVGLNVFSEKDGGSRIILSLNKGEYVHVLEYGEYANWKGITARWARVKTADDRTGWLFSGFLENI